MPNVSANIDTFLRSADNAAALANLGALPLTGGTLTGSLSISSGDDISSGLSATNLAFSDSGSGGSLLIETPLNFNTFTSLRWPVADGSLISDGSVWPNANPIGWTDTQLRRDGQANTLAIRGTTNAGTVTNRFHIYGFYNNASNYVRASLHCSGTLVTISAERAGTGSANVDIDITPAGTTGRINVMGQTAVAGVIACTHTALIKVNGTQYKVLLSNL
jgi:hypothetical protein